MDNRPRMSRQFRLNRSAKGLGAVKLAEAKISNERQRSSVSVKKGSWTAPRAKEQDTKSASINFLKADEPITENTVPSFG
jgi:hypothetical protein